MPFARAKRVEKARFEAQNEVFEVVLEDFSGDKGRISE